MCAAMATTARRSQRPMPPHHHIARDPPRWPQGAEEECAPLGWRRSGEEASPSELSPGLLDLHSFDTELLPEVAVSESCGIGDSFGCAQGRNAGDFDTGLYANKFSSQLPLSDNNLMKNLLSDREKSGPAAKIKVVVRKRPLNKKEACRREEDVITISPSTNSLTVHETKLKVDLTEYVEKHEFVFDAVLDEDVSNEKVYRETVQPIVPAIFQRTKATCFAYGQTGSGKTYTMQPLPLKASQDILRLMYHTYRNQGYQLFVSFFEIYGGKLFDLLNDRRKLCMREDGKQQVCIVGLQEFRVSDVETISAFIEKGNATRSTGTTGANEESSRSHAILQLAIKRSTDGCESKPARMVGKLSFIDLAGSERGADTTDNDKQTRIEGAEINKSLLALKECIRALDNDQVHIPFRGSKLTEVLRDSFIGNSRTVMISCISPTSGSCEHTLNTLRYADRVKSLSKGNNSKKDASLSVGLRDSTILPLSSIAPSVGVGGIDTYERNRFGWPRPSASVSSLPFNARESFRAHQEVGMVVNSEDYLHDSQFQIPVPDFEFYEPRERDELQQRKGKLDVHKPAILIDRSINAMTKRLDGPGLGAKWRQSDEELNALLKVEEDLVIAHKKQLEETIDIVKEEMKLLVEVDQPGNQLDDYVSKLSTILSQKAAGIVNLQTRLANFQRLLKENCVLVSAAND